MSEVVSDKIENYRTAPFDARFPKNNQTRNCSQKYLVEDHCDFHRCNKALTAKGQDVSPCQWYQSLQEPLPNKLGFYMGRADREWKFPRKDLSSPAVTVGCRTVTCTLTSARCRH